MSNTIDGKEKSPAPYSHVVKGSRYGNGRRKSKGGDIDGHPITPAVESDSLEIVAGSPPGHANHTGNGHGGHRRSRKKPFGYHGIGSSTSSELTATQEYLDDQAAKENAAAYLDETQPGHRQSHRVREAESLIEASVRAAAVIKRVASRLAFDLQTVGESTLLDPDVDDVAKALRDLGRFGFELLDLQRKVMLARHVKSEERWERELAEAGKG